MSPEAFAVITCLLDFRQYWTFIKLLPQYHMLLGSNLNSLPWLWSLKHGSIVNFIPFEGRAVFLCQQSPQETISFAKAPFTTRQISDRAFLVDRGYFPGGSSPALFCSQCLTSQGKRSLIHTLGVAASLCSESACLLQSLLCGASATVCIEGPKAQYASSSAISPGALGKWCSHWCGYGSVS